MEKGVKKKNSMKMMKKRRKIKGFAMAIADYLLSDSYMYAPLIDSHPLISDSGAEPEPSTPLRAQTRSPASTAGKGVPVVQLQRVLAK